MNEELQSRSERFTTLLTDSLVALIRKRGIKTTVIAEEIGIGQASMSRYISHKREMPMSVFFAVCEFIDANPRKIMDDVFSQIDDTDADAMVRSLDAGDMETFGLAANYDENSEQEAQGGDGR